MNAATVPLALPLAPPPAPRPRLALGMAVGLLAASIGALYTVFARWGIAHGLAALMAWPVLGHAPGVAETTGLVVVMSGLVLAVTGAGKPPAAAAASK